MLNGEDYDVHQILENKSSANYKHFFGHLQLLAIDEAQNIPDIGGKLKFLVDELPELIVMASGSSSFDLKNKAGEPLVGRSTSYLLCPFTREEIAQIMSPFDLMRNLEFHIQYGSYPDVVLLSNHHEKEEYLHDMVDAYLLKDILTLDGIKNAGKMRDLLRLIAYQIGSEVSLEELARQLSMSRNTVEKYLDLLSKVYVIFRVGSYSRNLRKEISKAGKWYFYDTGIRNAIIGNFTPLTLRQDSGHLWENYVISERVKQNLHHRWGKNFYFWKTYDRQEIDLIEEKDLTIEAFEVKEGNKHPSPPKAFASAYPDAVYNVINKDTFTQFI